MRSVAPAIVWPCASPITSVRRTSMSSVPAGYRLLPAVISKPHACPPLECLCEIIYAPLESLWEGVDPTLTEKLRIAEQLAHKTQTTHPRAPAAARVRIANASGQHSSQRRSQITEPSLKFASECGLSEAIQAGARFEDFCVSLDWSAALVSPYPGARSGAPKTGCLTLSR